MPKFGIGSHPSLRRWLIHATALSLVVGTVVSLPQSAEAKEVKPPAEQRWTGVQGGRPATAAAAPKRPATPVWTPPAVSWPAAGSATVDLTTAETMRGTRQSDGTLSLKAGTLPVRIARAGAGTGSDLLKVTLTDRAASERAGVNGLLLQAHPVDAAAKPGAVRVSVDPSGIAGAYGGDWATRLRLVSLPECALRTPELAGCTAQTPVLTSRERDGFLTGQVNVSAAAPAVFALAAGEAGDAGDYSATPMKPSGTWTAGGSSGGFTYTYPIALPPVPGAFAPSVGLAYSSQAVDGQMVATNNQSSAFGDGWSYAPGSVERTYRPCKEIDASPKKTKDSCWAGHLVHVSFGAGSGDLVYDASLPTKWKMADDDGAKVERLFGADNGDADGEYWKITTKDGTQYFFGLNKLPGFTAGKDATNSAWTQRVYGPTSADECFKASGFDQSWCEQGYKWNLDYVVDPSHNAYAYYYKTEMSQYGPNGSTTGVPYVRGGYLDHIDYGLRDPNPYATSAPARVQFTTTERCVESASVCAPGNIATNRTKWPDTPYDLNCEAGKPCYVHATTFWSRIRATGIATQIWNGTGYTPVDSYALTQSYPSPEDGTTPGLWLQSIQRTGGSGAGAITLPATSFEPTRLANRADGLDSAPAMNHHRISAVTTETGEVIGIGYRTECTAPVTIDPSQNTSLCYPVYWTKEGQNDPTRDWFHKYVVTQITDQDPTGKNPPQATSYEYLGGGAWHLDDNELTKAKHRTYGQWRGFGRVRTRTGGDDEPKTLSEAVYFRGMDGDKLPDGSRRSVSVSLSADVPVAGATTSVPDLNRLAGSVRENIKYLSDGGPADSASVTDYWVSPASATRTRTVVDNLVATMVRPVTGWKVTAVTSASPATWLTTRTDTTYDTATGLPTVVYDHGDVTKVSQATCAVITYAPASTTLHLLGLVAQSETVAKPCGGSGVNGLTAPANVNRPAEVISATRTFYDTASFDTTWPQAPPTAGKISVTQQARGYTGGAFEWLTTGKMLYDAYGRPTSGTGPTGKTATTAYTETNGLTTKVVAKNPMQQATTTYYDPARGLATGGLDSNNLSSTLTYDALGRTTGVWVPGRALNQGANKKYAYQVSQTVPSTVTEQMLNDDGSYTTAVSFYDALTRLRQLQSQSPSGGRVVSDSFYDSHGWVVKSSNSYYDTSSAPSTTMLDMTGHDNQIPNQVITQYDGLGRAVVTTAMSKGLPKFQTRTIYGGDRTTVIPPQGGTPTTEIFDGRGRIVELASYSSTPTVNGSVVSGGSPVRLTYGYTVRGQRGTVTDHTGKIWSTTYDLLGRATGTSDPDSGSSTSTYDDDGNVLTATDSLQQLTSYRYDDLGRLTAQYDGATTTTPVATWSYDSTTITNGIGQLASSSTFIGGHEYKSAVSGYDTWGNTKGVTVTIPAAPGNGALANTYTFSNTYTTTNGLLQKTVFPGGGGLPAETVNRTYTALDLPSGVGSSLGNYVDSTRYNAFGQISQTKFGFGTTNVAWQTNIYDEFTSRTVNSYVDRTGTGTTRIHDMAYKYNDDGQLISTTNARNGNARSETQCFRYDLLGRLTTAWTATDNCAADLSTGTGNTTVGGIDPYWTSWKYNSAGNRTEEVRHAVPGVTGDTRVDYTYPNGQPNTLEKATTSGPAGTSASVYQYDAMGQLKTRTTPERGTQTFNWNRRHQLTSVTTGSTVNAAYVYDTGGNLLIQRDPGTKTTTLYLPGQELTLNTDTNVVTGRRYYKAPDGTVCVRTGTTASAYSYLFTDNAGTSTLTLDRNGANPSWRATTPYGAPRGTQPASWPDVRGYLGMPVDDATGLTILGARHYDPALGRFISLDPLLDTGDPDQLGGYAYVSNDPVNSSDPSGMLGSASCAPGELGGPGACTGSEDPDGDSKVDGFVQETLPNGTVITQNWDKHYVNNLNVDRIVKPCRIDSPSTEKCNGNPNHPTLWFLGQNADRYVGENPLPVDYYYEDVTGWVIIMSYYEYVKDHDPVLIMALQSLNSTLEAALKSSISFINPAIVGAMGSAVKAGSSVRSPYGQRNPGIKCGGGHSFAAETLVLMADGSAKRLDEIVPGDVVATVDPESGVRSGQPVTALLRHTDYDLTELVVTTGDGRLEIISTTEGHLFWSETAATWKPALELVAGELLRTPQGRPVTVVAGVNHTGVREMFDLTVDVVHTYFVLAGPYPVLVHNQDTPPNAVTEVIRLVQNGGGTRRQNPDKTNDVIRGGGGFASTGTANRWKDSQVYNVPGTGDRYRVLVNPHGDIAWVDVEDGKYTKVKVTGLKAPRSALAPGVTPGTGCP